MRERAAQAAPARHAAPRAYIRQVAGSGPSPADGHAEAKAEIVD
jgi:hypothetical protein